jgi:hypothetical protein
MRPEPSAAAALSSVGESATRTSSRPSESLTVRPVSTSCATSCVPAATASTGEVMPHEETESEAAPLTLKSDLTLAGHGRAKLPSIGPPASASASALASAPASSPSEPPDCRSPPTLAALERPCLAEALSSASLTLYARPGTAMPRAYAGVVGDGGRSAVSTKASVGIVVSMTIAAMGKPTQKQRSMSAPSRSHSMMQPSSEAEQACSMFAGLCATAVTWSVCPSSMRTCAPVLHENTLTTLPEQQSKYLLSVLKLQSCSTSEPPDSSEHSAPSGRLVRTSSPGPLTTTAAAAGEPLGAAFFWAELSSFFLDEGDFFGLALVELGVVGMLSGTTCWERGVGTRRPTPPRSSDGVDLGEGLCLSACEIALHRDQIREISKRR